MKLLKDSLRKCKSLDLCLVKFGSPFELNPARVQL